MKRILILSFYYYPDLSAGSFRTTAFVNQLQKQVSLDDKIEVIATMPNRYKSFSQETLKFEIYKNVIIHRIDVGKHKGGFLSQVFLFIKFMIKVFLLIRKKEKYDIVYATSSRLMTAFLGAIISKKQKSKLFLDIRDIFTDTLESVFQNSKIKYIIPIFKYIEKYTINSANHINLVSEGFKEYFYRLNKDISYSFYPNGIDSIFLKYDFKKVNRDYKRIITYAGNIGEGQGLERIIPLLAKYLDKYEFHIFGDGGAKNKLIESIDDIKNIKLFDPVNREELLKIYKNSDILFLHLNDYEAFKKVLPSKIFEYAATNKFIIAGVSGYAKEFIIKNIDGVVVFEPCNIDDFISKFNDTLLQNNIDRTQFIREFSRDNIMNEMSKVILTLG